MKSRFVIPSIPEAERTPLVIALLGVIEGMAQHIQQQAEHIELLKEEIRILKGGRKRPQFKPSKMDERTEDADPPSNKADKRRAGSDKRHKTAELIIHEEQIIRPRGAVPAGSRFKGYRDVVVQDLVIRAHNTRYRLERWLTAQGKVLKAVLPKAVKQHRFGAKLRSYVLYQHNQCQVTQPLLREQLREWGIDISAGAIDSLLSAHHEPFHAEKDALLQGALDKASYVTVDDTGTRHRGSNGTVTTIGNDFFAWFGSTMSKSRINFLELLCAGQVGFQINDTALTYMHKQGLSQPLLNALRDHPQQFTAHAQTWQEHLSALSIHRDWYRQIATEGALIGLLADRGLTERLTIVSDDAGQFNVLQHALCWIHAERLIHHTLPLNEDHREDIASVRDELWNLYRNLKAYQRRPNPEDKRKLTRRFDRLFTRKTRYQTLNQLLQRLHRNKAELLLVLERPEIPLHTNNSERDIRDYVKKRKVSGGTRSDLGRQCRDTFTSLKKTCRKLGVSFWDYLNDRMGALGKIPPLPYILETELLLA